MIAPAIVRQSAPAEELRDLARMVRSLLPDRRDPERFHLEKDEAAARMAALARRIENEAA